MSSLISLQRRLFKVSEKLSGWEEKEEELDLSLMTDEEQQRLRRLDGLVTAGKWPNIGALTDVELEEYRHLGELLWALIAGDEEKIQRYRRRLAHTQAETEALFFALNIPEDTLLHTYTPCNTYRHMKRCIREGRQGANQASQLWDWIERFENSEKAQWHLDLLRQLERLKQHMHTTRDLSCLSEYRQKLRELGDM